MSALRERLWELGYYLRHPLTWLCDKGYRECRAHRQTGFYDYLRGVSVAGGEEDILTWVADEEEWAELWGLLEDDEERDMPKLRELLNSTPPWDEDDERSTP